MKQIETSNVGPHGHEERREGRTRAQTRALNQQHATGLLATLGPVSGNHILRVLIAEQRTLKKPNEVAADPAKGAQPEPTTFAEARASVHAELWEGAMNSEFEGLLAAGTFSLVGSVPEGSNIVNAKWVYKWKTDSNGEILKAKARLVAKGFSQRYQVDFLEVFSPTASAATIRILVALANIHGWDLSHFDVEQAFVQSKLDYEVYMRLPPGCGSMTGNIVLLNKALYGLKQSARQFYKLYLIHI